MKKKKTGDVTTISGERVVLARRPFWKDVVWVETWERRSRPYKQLKEEQPMQGKQQVQTPWGRKEAGIFRTEAGGAEAITAVWEEVEEEGPIGFCRSQKAVLTSFHCTRKPWSARLGQWCDLICTFISSVWLIPEMQRIYSGEVSVKRGGPVGRSTWAVMVTGRSGGGV